MRSVEIYFDDLCMERQADLLFCAGIESPEEANWDILPITILDFEEDEDGSWLEPQSNP